MKTRKLNRSYLFHLSVALFIAVSGMIMASSCGASNVSYDEAYDAGYTFGRMLRGN